MTTRWPYYLDNYPDNFCLGEAAAMFPPGTIVYNYSNSSDNAEHVAIEILPGKAGANCKHFGTCFMLDALMYICVSETPDGAWGVHVNEQVAFKDKYGAMGTTGQ